MPSPDVLKITVECDTTEIDNALAKLETMTQKIEQVSASGLLPGAVAVVVAASSSQKSLTRRSLLGFGFLRKR